MKVGMGRKPAWRRSLLLLVFLGATLVTSPAPAQAGTFTFGGTVSAGGTAFRAHTFPVSEASTITATLDWNDPAADLTLSLFKPGGTFVKGTGGSSAKPEVIAYEAGETGTWKLGVKALSGSATYTLVVDVVPTGGGGPVTPTYARTIGGPGHAEAYPSGLDVSPSGTVFIADTGNSQVAAYTSGGSEIWRIGSRGYGSLSRYNYPRDVAFMSGKVYVGDTGNSRVVVLDASDGTPLSQWTGFKGLMGVSAGVDGAGNGVVFVTEDQTHQIQVRTPAGALIRTIGAGPGAGNGQLKQPRDAASDSGGNVYVADYGNNRISKFGPAGGWLANWANAGGGLSMKRPYGVDVDDSNAVYVADSNNDRIEKFTGSGGFLDAFGSSGTGDGQFRNLRRVAVGSGSTPDVFGADLWLYRVLRFNQAGDQLDVVPSPASGPPPGRFNEPSGIAVDTSVFVVDALNQRLHRFSPTGILETTWGHRGWGSDLSGVNWPRDIATSAATSTVWVADTRSSRLLEFTRAGAPTGRSLGTGFPGSGMLQFNWPSGVTVIAGDLIVADANNNRVQRIDPDGPSVVWTATGFNKPEDVVVSGTTVLVADGGNHRIVRLDLGTGANEGSFGSSSLHYAGGIAVDATGNVWVSDSTWNRLVEFGPAGAQRQTFGSPGSAHGQFNNPRKLAIASGALYVADQWGDRVEVFDLG
jgi:sugar lactone lactonase YvrE